MVMTAVNMMSRLSFAWRQAACVRVNMPWLYDSHRGLANSTKWPVYKLTYLDQQAKGEASRWIFAAAGVPFEDVRISREKWRSLAPGSPFGQVPLLEVNGNTLCQSHAIEGYLARQFGLAGKTEWDSARADMIVLCCEDMFTAIIPLWREKDSEKREALQRKIEDETLPAMLNNFDKLLPEGHNYFVGNQLTVADVVFASYHGAIEFTKLSVDWDKFHRLKSLVERVKSNQGIAEWLSKNKEVPFRNIPFP